MLLIFETGYYLGGCSLPEDDYELIEVPSSGMET